MVLVITQCVLNQAQALLHRGRVNICGGPMSSCAMALVMDDLMLNPVISDICYAFRIYATCKF